MRREDFLLHVVAVVPLDGMEEEVVMVVVLVLLVLLDLDLIVVLVVQNIMMEVFQQLECCHQEQLVVK